MEATVPTVHSSQQVMKAEDSPDKGDSEKDTSLLTSTEIPHHDDPAVSNAMIEEILNIILPNSEPEMIMQVTCNKPVKLDVLLMKLQKTIEDCRLLNYVQEDRKVQTIQTHEHLEEYLRVSVAKRSQLRVATHEPEEEKHLTLCAQWNLPHISVGS